MNADSMLSEGTFCGLMKQKSLKKSFHLSGMPLLRSFMEAVWLLGDE